MAKELRVTFSKLGTTSKLAKYNGQGDEVGVDGVVKWKEDGIVNTVNTHVNALDAVSRVPEHVQTVTEGGAGDEVLKLRQHHGHRSGQCHGRGGSVVAVVIPLCDHEAFDLRINCR